MHGGVQQERPKRGNKLRRCRGYATEFDVGTYFLHDAPQDVLRLTGRNNHARKPRPGSASPVASSAGLISPFMFLQEETTAFSRSNFNGVSRVKGSERKWRNYRRPSRRIVECGRTDREACCV